MIRVASPFDAPLLAALQNRCFPEEPWPAESVAALLGSPGAQALIAAGPGKTPEPAGFVIFRTIFFEAEVISLGVLPEFQRSGIGRRLLDALVDSAKADGADSVFLEVAEDNLAARALYAGKGFVPVGFRPDYYSRPGGPVSAHVLRLDLRAGLGCG